MFLLVIHYTNIIGNHILMSLIGLFLLDILGYSLNYTHNNRMSILKHLGHLPLPSHIYLINPNRQKRRNYIQHCLYNLSYQFLDIQNKHLLSH